MAISNKEKFLQQKNEIRSIRYFYSGTDIYDTYKDVDTLAEKQDISADFLLWFLQNIVKYSLRTNTEVFAFKLKG